MKAEEAGSTDPARALELLWGRRALPSRGPRPGLAPERIVRAAIEIADEEGLAALSMRRVAGRLGVGTASLYTYIPGRPELLALMLDTMIGDGPLPHTLPGGWREKVQAWARDDWEGYQRHPWVLQVVSDRPSVGPRLMEWYESALRALDGTGLTESETVAAVESVDGYVRGVARLAADAAETERRTGVSQEAWEAAQEAFLREHADFSRYPRWVGAAAAGAFGDPVQNFEFGLQRILDGIEAVIRARSGEGTQS
ncbi:TetR/AcrR family transcriptional regulator [Allosalinactinospora lopnorensis]|uniref:TetR/AcrR family transcriptional regulator n=1 Tax=Allosalinactinospora lopnorensis TaxID=1352348 RepID=UPI000623DB72|nr:TetR/AcrR family transcriptional regulator [Allosalinactinospora lopnorensis]